MLRLACLPCLPCLLLAACIGAVHLDAGLDAGRLGGTAAKVASAVQAGLTIDGQLQITLDAWGKISARTGGLALTSKGAKDVPGLITDVFERGIAPGQPVDLVFVVDTTGSMGDDIDAVKADMQRILRELSARNPDRRIGVVAYRDRGDDYVSKTMLAMSDDDAQIRGAIDSLKVDGGGDLREHVYAGIDTALVEQPWRSGASQHIILMGDAPPHDNYSDDPRNFQSVLARASATPLAVRIHTIGLTCDKLCQALIIAGA
jgi:hypothetical protein